MLIKRCCHNGWSYYPLAESHILYQSIFHLVFSNKDQRVAPHSLKGHLLCLKQDPQAEVFPSLTLRMEGSIKYLNKTMVPETILLVWLWIFFKDSAVVEKLPIEDGTTDKSISHAAPNRSSLLCHRHWFTLCLLNVGMSSAPLRKLIFTEGMLQGDGWWKTCKERVQRLY